MTEVRFYHLQKQTLDQALPLIVEKAFSAGHKINIRLNNAQDVEHMNNVLWVYKPNVFLPHGSIKNGHAADQPIWLTDKDENPNQATVLITSQNTQPENIETYDLCCDILDGQDQESVSAGRKKWKTYQAAGYDVTYWYQNEKGGWEKKAAS